MNKASTTTVLLLVALGAGWLVGSQTGGGDADATDKEIVRLQEDNARLRRTLGERGPTLEPGVGLKGSADPERPDAPTTAAKQVPPRVGEVTAFDIAAFDHPDKAFQTLLAYAATMLARGEEGHLALLETINRTFADKPGERMVRLLLGDERNGVRYLYPVIRFALNHDAQVVDMTETIFKTMAESPQKLAEMDNESLELFTEGIALMLPGMVDEQRLQRMRGYAMGILETPESKQPRSVQRQRRDIQRAIESWAPAISAEEALQRLRAGTATPEEAYSLLRRLRPEDVRDLDLDALVGPLLEREGWRVITLVSQLKPDAQTRAKFDARFIRAVQGGTASLQMVRTWLYWTGRRSWDDARTFVEAGLQGGTVKTNGAFLMAALSLEPGPDDDWVDWAEQTYEFETDVRLVLKRRREKRGK